MSIVVNKLIPKIVEHEGLMVDGYELLMSDGMTYVLARDGRSSSYCLYSKYDGTKYDMFTTLTDVVSFINELIR